MRIIFKAIRKDASLTVRVAGDIVSVNDVDYDFSDLADGHRLPLEALDCEVFADDAVRDKGKLCISLLRPYDRDGSATPDTWTTRITDGEVDFARCSQ